MKFKGDIIITDPCYIIKEAEDYKDMKSKPKWEDYITVEYKDNKELFLKQSAKYNEAYNAWEEKNKDHWELCDYGESMEKLGINTYLTRSTEDGDWSCTTYKTNNKTKKKERIGNFCADVGMVSVFLLEEVLKYNPNFNYHTEKLWTTTLIKDFDGEVNIKLVKVGKKGDEEVRVIGKGNIDFFTTQTGF
jgi:hypothetical protein